MNLRFPGQYFDEESETHYNFQRNYCSRTGRYLQADPIGLYGGINVYGYVLQNPVNGIDPDGLLLNGLLPFGECYGDAAAQYWANKQVQTGNWLYAIPGLFASLWTPSTSDYTLSTLMIGYGAGGLVRSLANLPEWLSNPLLYERGQVTLTNYEFAKVADLSALERGRVIGYGKSINLRWLLNLGSGPTPGGSLLSILMGIDNGATTIYTGGHGQQCGH